MRAAIRGGAALYSRQQLQPRSLSTSFAELYRKSVDSAPLQPGDALQGHVVGSRRPRSASSRFYIVDFGLKSEAPFTAKEIPGASTIGDEVSMPLLGLEDDFNEPVFDYERRAELPTLTAERYALLTKTAKSNVRMVHGRFAAFKRGGASVKVLGTDAFAPRYHIVAIDRPVLGSFAPFYLMSVSADRRSTSATPSLDINPVVSSYGGFLFCLANLVGIDEAWQKSGGGSSKERLAYLQLLTRLLVMKNTAVRKILPKNNEAARNRLPRRYERVDAAAREASDTAWLNDLPQGDWASSGHDNAGNLWDPLRRPVALRRQQKAATDATKVGKLRGGFGRGRSDGRSGAEPTEEH